MYGVCMSVCVCVCMYTCTHVHWGRRSAPRQPGPWSRRCRFPPGTFSLLSVLILLHLLLYRLKRWWMDEYMSEWIPRWVNGGRWIDD